MALPSPPDTLLSVLTTSIPPFSPDTPTLKAYEAFKADATLYAIAVVDSTGRPLGLLNRFKFLELLSRPFAHDLFRHQTAAMVMDSAPLVVDEHVALDQLSHALVDSARYIFDGFVVTRESKYLGIGTGYSLMRLLTEREHATLFHLAHHDSLTGLPNRQLFGDRLTQALSLAGRHDKPLAVLYVDVDRLKTINDGLGHVVGDMLIRSIADRLAANVRAEDTAARLGGDEFGIILTELHSADESDVVARKLLAAIREPHEIEHHRVNTSCSIGIAVFPSDGATQTSLLRAADAATYHAKRFRNTFHRYSPGLQHPQSSTLPAYESVRRALDDGHLSVAFQPQIVASTGALIGLEVLARWNDPVRGAMPASELIRLAEDGGLIGAVTDFVLNAALRQMIDWRLAGLATDISLAVNISGTELHDGTMDMLQRHLAATGFPPSSLEVEITESTAMHAGTATTEVLNQLTSLGVCLSIDDFGTGYSSLTRLRHLPVSGLKIDRTFVDDIEHRDAGALARAIIVLAHSLGLVVTGEGVETEEQRAFLTQHGCDRIQGYVHSRPLDTEAMTAYLRQRAHNAAPR
jgi:diguanylate cyclase (GGDEF)-like protein